jgi:hypothetical protein
MCQCQLSQMVLLWRVSGGTFKLDIAQPLPISALHALLEKLIISGIVKVNALHALAVGLPSIEVLAGWFNHFVLLVEEVGEFQSGTFMYHESPVALADLGTFLVLQMVAISR